MTSINDVLQLNNFKGNPYYHGGQVRLKKSVLKKVGDGKDARVYKLKTQKGNFALKHYHNENYKGRYTQINREVLDIYYVIQKMYREYIRNHTNEVDVIGDSLFGFSLTLDFQEEIYNSTRVEDSSYRVVMPRLKGNPLAEYDSLYLNNFYRIMTSDPELAKLYDEICTINNVKKNNNGPMVISDLGKNIVEFTNRIIIDRLRKRLAFS